MLPLAVETVMLALLCYAAGLALGWIVWGRRR